MSIAEKLASIRREKGFTQSEVAEYLNHHSNKNCSYKNISHWETGVALPSIEQFILMCELYEIKDIQKVFRSAEFEYRGPSRLIKLFDIPVGAGFESYLLSDSYKEISVDSNTVPKGTDFALRITGNSMEPRFVDGQLIFIKSQYFLDSGELGIFVLNDKAYFKKMGKGELLSFNPNYQPIKIEENDSLQIFGKVLG